MGRGRVYAHKDTVGGAEMTLTASKFGGFMLNGSAGSSTLTIYDGAVLLVSTSAGANGIIREIYDVPVACTTSILGTCSGTGYYSILVSN